MISIKKYLDANTVASADESGRGVLHDAAVDAYRSALRAIGKNAIRACQAPGVELEQQLARLEGSLAQHPSAKVLGETRLQVEDRLDRWGRLTAEHLKGKADEVRELLIMLARTAESVGERDQRFTNQFVDLTAKLKAIAGLDDLSVIQASLVRKATELRNCVDQMTREGQQSLSELRTRISGYETKLKLVEELALRDQLTGLANRRSGKTRMEWYVDQKQIFCVILIDLDDFKRINDQHGHAVGDDLLRKFSDELCKHTRVTDLVVRWGGDEFILILSCDLACAGSQVERIQQWVFGKYKIQKGKEVLQFNVEASIGLAQWLPGMTGKQVIEQADAAMYQDKGRTRQEALAAHPGKELNDAGRGSR
jgi:diguanylate cyclase (GGDEF)-like protein